MDREQFVQDVVSDYCVTACHLRPTFRHTRPSCLVDIVEACDGLACLREEQCGREYERADVCCGDCGDDHGREELVERFDVAAVIVAILHEAEHAPEVELPNHVKCVPFREVSL